MVSETRKQTEPYRVVARRFRPRSFDEVVGQDAVLRTLRSALSSGQVPHAFLFAGSRGVGKTTTARILARALNCERGPTPEPCGVCAACVSIGEGSHPDVVEIDAASHNLVDDIRELRERVGFASMGGRYKVYILDEVHMLTRSAFNAFLKTLEEPPPGVVFVLATTELHKVPETIRSRCQVQLFRRIDENDMVARLCEICRAEGIELDDAVLQELVAGCRGGMRDAETALERLLPVARESGGRLDVETWRRLAHRVGTDEVVATVAALLSGDAGKALAFAAETASSGVDEREALGEILDVLRAVLLLMVDGEDTMLVPYSGRMREALHELANEAQRHQVEAAIQAGLLARDRIRRLEDRRLVLELALLRMAEAGTLPSLGELAAAVAGGATAAAVTGVPATAGPRTPPSGGGDLKGRLLARLQREQPLLVRTIEQCDVKPPTAGVVVLELRTDRKLHRDRLAADGIQKLLRNALADLVGDDALQLQVKSEAGATPVAPAAPAGSHQRKPGPAVRKVVERFDGHILDEQGS